MSELVRKAETDIEGLRQRLAEAGALGGELSSSSHIHVSRSAELLQAARSLGVDGAVDAMAAVTGDVPSYRSHVSWVATQDVATHQSAAISIYGAPLVLKCFSSESQSFRN